MSFVVSRDKGSASAEAQSIAFERYEQVTYGREDFTVKS